jgi:hypothetical protein
MIFMWKKTEYEGYEVSQMGQVRSVDRVIHIQCPHNGSAGCRCNTRRVLKGKVLKQNLCGGNLPGGEYPFVNLGNQNRCVYVHILVAKAFVPNPNNLPEVNHVDGNKLDPYHKNLEWTTRQGNEEHAHRIGLKGRNIHGEFCST